MAAARFSSNVLQTFYGSIAREQNRNLPKPLQPERVPVRDVFKISQSNFQGWLRVWIMNVSQTNPNNKDIYMFKNANKEKYTNLIEQEIQKLGSVKVSFGLKVNFKIERNGETQEMSHYFKEDQPHVFTRYDKEQIEQKYEEFMGRIKGEIENWSLQGSGWEIESIELAYVNVAKYQPLRGGTYLPLPADLAKKKAIINVKNKDNECLKWALRAALFPPQDGKNPQRPSRYPVKNDGINYKGIDIPTPVKQIDKLEKQNPNLAINVFGWENDTVIVHRISRKEPNVPRINLMLIESGKIQHYCYVKRESALLFDQSKNRNAKHYCMMCLTGFSRADLLVDHKKYCNGVNGRPTRIEMPKEGENILAFQNYQKQMKAPYVIYADFEALVKKIQGCERAPEKNKSYTEKTEWHEACGYSYIVVKSDGEVTGSKVYRGVNAVKSFLESIMQEKEKIRQMLTQQKPVTMTHEDWYDFKNAYNCHICEKKLVKENYWDSLPVYTKGLITKKEKYQGQYHKRCFFNEQKDRQEEFELQGCNATEEDDFEMIILKKPEQKDKQKAKKQTDCYLCKKPLLQKNYRDAVKDHCHITGKYRGAAHNQCNLKLRINPKTDQIPVVFHNLRGYDAHHLMQAMANLKKEVKCVANNMEKYITISVDGLRFIDSLNFLQGSLDSLVKVIVKGVEEATSKLKDRELQYKKKIKEELKNSAKQVCLKKKTSTANSTMNTLQKMSTLTRRQYGRLLIVKHWGITMTFT